MGYGFIQIQDLAGKQGPRGEFRHIRILTWRCGSGGDQFVSVLRISTEGSQRGGEGFLEDLPF